MDELRRVFHLEARLEALAAHDYYAEKSVTLGAAFETELANAIVAIGWCNFLSVL